MGFLRGGCIKDFDGGLGAAQTSFMVPLATPLPFVGTEVGAGADFLGGNFRTGFLGGVAFSS